MKEKSIALSVAMPVYASIEVSSNNYYDGGSSLKFVYISQLLFINGAVIIRDPRLLGYVYGRGGGELPFICKGSRAIIRV